jgi:SulP family sulfate permease
VNALAGIEGEELWADETAYTSQIKQCVYVKHLYGPLFFGFTSAFQELIRNLDEDICALIIRMDRVPHMDQSGLYAMEEAILDLTRRGVTVLLTGLDIQPSDMLKRIKVIPDLIPEEQIFEEFEDSIRWLKNKDMIIQPGEIKAV